MKNKLIIFGLLIIGYFTYWNVSNFFDARKIHTLSKRFKGSNISGKLDYYDVKHGGIVFKLVNESEEYYFYPLAINGITKFNEIAEEGDSIIKRPYSDTLKLINNGKKYLYTTQKYR